MIGYYALITLVTVCVLILVAISVCAPILEKLPDGYWILHYTIPFTRTRTYIRFTF